MAVAAAVASEADPLEALLDATTAATHEEMTSETTTRRGAAIRGHEVVQRVLTDAAAEAALHSEMAAADDPELPRVGPLQPIPTHVNLHFHAFLVSKYWTKNYIKLEFLV